jgi:hypothetical protein
MKRLEGGAGGISYRTNIQNPFAFSKKAEQLLAERNCLIVNYLWYLRGF